MLHKKPQTNLQPGFFEMVRDSHKGNEGRDQKEGETDTDGCTRIKSQPFGAIEKSDFPASNPTNGQWNDRHNGRDQKDEKILDGVHRHR